MLPLTARHPFVFPVAPPRTAPIFPLTPRYGPPTLAAAFLPTVRPRPQSACSFSFPLQDLSCELVAEIVTGMDDPADLASMALVNRALYASATRQLYRFPACDDDSIGGLLRTLRNRADLRCRLRGLFFRRSANAATTQSRPDGVAQSLLALLGQTKAWTILTIDWSFMNETIDSTGLFAILSKFSDVRSFEISGASQPVELRCLQDCLGAWPKLAQLSLWRLDDLTSLPSTIPSDLTPSFICESLTELLLIRPRLTNTEFVSFVSTISPKLKVLVLELDGTQTPNEEGLLEALDTIGHQLRELHVDRLWRHPDGGDRTFAFQVLRRCARLEQLTLLGESVDCKFLNLGSPTLQMLDLGWTSSITFTDMIATLQSRRFPKLTSLRVFVEVSRWYVALRSQFDDDL